MNYRVAKVVKGYQPILVAGKRLILLRGDNVYVTDFDLNRVDLLCKIPPVRRLLSRIRLRLLDRVFRNGAESAALADDGHIFVARRSQIFRISLTTGQCSLDFTIPDNRRLLNLSIISDSDEKRYLAFGEYFNNPSKYAVALWRRELNGSAEWMQAGVFAENEIDHVHNICQSRDGQIRVLTGDFEQGAAIWSGNRDLSRFSPLMRGKQKYRACWLREASDGALFYATDSQFDTNQVFRYLPQEDGSPERVASIEGSSIYSAASEDRIFFSSSVEPGDGTGSLVRDMLDRTPGPGISSDAAVIYELRGGAVAEILRAKKDVWPMRLAQFGSFHFPHGVMPEDRLFAYGVGVCRFDGACLVLVRAE